jgi:hypothetical protein
MTTSAITDSVSDDCDIPRHHSKLILTFTPQVLIRLNAFGDAYFRSPPNTGQILVKYWSNTGSILVKDFRSPPIVVREWSMVEFRSNLDKKMLVKLGGGQTLVKLGGGRKSQSLSQGLRRSHRANRWKELMSEWS